MQPGFIHGFFDMGCEQISPGRKCRMDLGHDVAAAAGAQGGIGTTYNFMPDLMVKIYSLARENKMDEAREVQSVANKAIATVLRNGVLPACKHLISLYGVPYGECREPFMPLDENAKADLFENAWSVVEEFRRKI